jgi:hypothetical protein
MTEAIDTLNTSVPRAATPADLESPIVALFREWVAALNFANALGIDDAERGLQCDRINDTERRLRDSTPVARSDFAAIAYVAIHVLDGQGEPGAPATFGSNSDPWALAISGYLLGAFPDLAAIIAGDAR